MHVHTCFTANRGNEMIKHCCRFGHVPAHGDDIPIQEESTGAAGHLPQPKAEQLLRNTTLCDELLVPCLPRIRVRGQLGKLLLAKRSYSYTTTPKNSLEDPRLRDQPSEYQVQGERCLCAQPNTNRLGQHMWISLSSISAQIIACINHQSMRIQRAAVKSPTGTAAGDASCATEIIHALHAICLVHFCLTCSK